jgi:hypothetical protein
LLSKAAEAEAFAKLNAEGSKAGKNAAEKAHTETEAARQELARLLGEQKKQTNAAISSAKNNAARRNAAAEAAAVNAAYKLQQKELELAVARATAKGVQRAKNAVNQALNAEKRARANANATHRALLQQTTANKAAAQLATQRAVQAEAIARQRAQESAANKAAANEAARAAAAKANAAEARANAAEKAARESKSAANKAVANRARANANKAAANAKTAALAAITNHLTGVITGAIKNKVPGAPPAPKNKIPGNNMNLNVRATGGAGGNSRATGGAVTFNPTITVGGGGANTAAILAQFMKTAPPSMNSELLQHIKNALKNKGGSNLTGSNKKELMDQLVMLMDEREQLRTKTNNASKTRLAVVEIKIKTTKQLLKALGITMANNNIKTPSVPKNNINKALNITNRFSRLQKLYELFRQTKDMARKMRLAREIRLVIAKMYGSNVSTSNAIRNITNAGRLVGRGAVSKNVNRNL